MDTKDDEKMKAGLKFSSSNVGRDCPEGTVAIRETKREVVERVGSVASYVSKRISVGPPRKDQTPDGEGHEVNPSEYGDSLPHFFVYWTADGYQNTGCSNLNCPGFVVAPGSTNYLGSPVAPTSTYNGEQRILIIKVSKANDRWNLYVNNQLLGWWPASLFKNLRSAANRVDFGGEVSFRSGGSPGSQFTTTDMGSGHFPSEGFGRSAHIRDVQITDNNGQLIDIPGSVAAGRPHCYNVSIYLDVQNGKHIFFGGPGGDNPGCVV